MQRISQTTFYAPNVRSKQSIIKTWMLIFRHVIAYRELTFQLFKRDFLMLYKKSFFGLGWHIAAPLIAIVSWLFLNATGVLDPGALGVPYPVYVLIGVTLWRFFMSLFLAAVDTLKIGSSIITQVNFPHEVLLFKQMLEQLAILLISLFIAIAAILIMGTVPRWQIIFLPLMVIPLSCFAAAFGLIFSVVGSSTDDIKKFFELTLNLLMFVTPIVYSLDKIQGALKTIVIWNPLTYLVGEMRNVVLFGRMNDPLTYTYVASASIVIFLFALRFFYVSEEKVIEKIM